MIPDHSDESRRRRVARPLRVEALEERLCLASSVELLGDGTLLVTGDNRSDSFEIVDDGQGVVGILGDIDLFGDGSFADPSGTYDAIFDGVDRIVVETFGGNDYVEYRLTDSLITPREVLMNLGNGNDRAVVSLGTIDGVDLFVDVNLGRGNDRLDAGFQGDWLDASVRFDVDGSAGNDDIGVVADNLYLDDLTALDIVLAGGVGNDLVTGDLDLAPSSTGLVAVSVLGERGNDAVQLNVYGVDNLADSSSLSLDGGPGRDQFGATTNVLVVNAERPFGRRR